MYFLNFSYNYLFNQINQIIYKITKDRKNNNNANIYNINKNRHVCFQFKFNQ